MYRRIGLSQAKSERERLGRLMLEMTHALFLCIIEESPSRPRRSFRDLQALCVTLLEQK